MRVTRPQWQWASSHTQQNTNQRTTDAKRRALDGLPLQTKISNTKQNAESATEGDNNILHVRSRIWHTPSDMVHNGRLVTDSYTDDHNVQNKLHKKRRNGSPTIETYKRVRHTPRTNTLICLKPSNLVFLAQTNKTRRSGPETDLDLLITKCN